MHIVITLEISKRLLTLLKVINPLGKRLHEAYKQTDLLPRVVSWCCKCICAAETSTSSTCLT